MKTGSPRLSVARINEALDYSADTGAFTWKRLNKKTTRAKVGAPAGCFDGRYIYITLDGIRFAAHRAAIAIISGRWPDCSQIDHIDGNGANNRASNLREADEAMNQQNQRRAQKSSSAGLLGVVPIPTRNSPKKYRAQIYINSKAKNLGYFMTAADAHQAYLEAKRKLHPSCTI